MKIQKPNWKPLELNEKLSRWRELGYQVENHDSDCQCNLCMEYFSLTEFLQLFSEDEKAGAVIESIKAGQK